MASSSGTREVLMLEAPPAPSGAPWRAPPDAEAVDALPYIDGDYGDPAVKREVDRMVEEEMRRGSRKPADFLRDLPPVPAIGFEVDSRSLISSPLLSLWVLGAALVQRRGRCVQLSFQAKKKIELYLFFRM